MSICKKCNKQFRPTSKFNPYQKFCSKTCRNVGYNTRRKLNPRFNRSLLRWQLINELGGKCAACGLNDSLVLTLDHINNDRKYRNTGREFNLTEIKRLLNNMLETKKRIQLLCWNHNALKQLHHETFNIRFPHLMI